MINCYTSTPPRCSEPHIGGVTIWAELICRRPLELGGLRGGALTVAGCAAATRQWLPPGENAAGISLCRRAGRRNYLAT